MVFFIVTMFSLNVFVTLDFIMLYIKPAFLYFLVIFLVSASNLYFRKIIKKYEYCNKYDKYIDYILINLYPYYNLLKYSHIIFLILIKLSWYFKLTFIFQMPYLLNIHTIYVIVSFRLNRRNFKLWKLFLLLLLKII